MNFILSELFVFSPLVTYSLETISCSILIHPHLQSKFGSSNLIEQLNFQNVFDDENNLYKDNHYCEYVEISQISKLTKTKYFSSFSHNVCSLPGHFDGLIDILDEARPHTFSVIALQEVWSISRNFHIPSYHKLEFCTRDMNEPLPNPNCGGGVGLFVHNKFSYEILNIQSSFIPGVYESIWVKIEVDKSKYKIIGNVYRPSSSLRNPWMSSGLLISSRNKNKLFCKK